MPFVSKPLLIDVYIDITGKKETFNRQEMVSELLYDICKSAYSDDEFARLQHKVNIFNGKEHSNIYSLH